MVAVLEAGGVVNWQCDVWLWNGGRIHLRKSKLLIGNSF